MDTYMLLGPTVSPSVVKSRISNGLPTRGRVLGDLLETVASNPSICIQGNVLDT